MNSTKLTGSLLVMISFSLMLFNFFSTPKRYQRVEEEIHMAHMDTSILGSQSEQNLTEKQVNTLDSAESKTEDFSFTESNMAMIMKMLLTVVFSFAGLFVMLSDKYGEQQVKWATSVLSLVVGYWLGSNF